MGDFASYSAYVPAEDNIAPRTGPSVRPSEGVTSVTLNGNQASVSNGKHDAISADQLSPYAADDWRSTARDRIGMPTSNITADSVVELAGMSGRVGDFVQAGVLRETPNGFEVVSTEGTPEAIEEVNPDAATMPEAVAQGVDSATEPFDDATLDAGLAHGIAAATGDMTVDDVVKGVAQRSGMDPAQAGERVQFVMDAYQAQADSYLTSNGLGADELPVFYEWAKQSGQKAALTAAIQKQAYGRDMSAWKPLVASFMRDVAPNLGALKANGYETNGNLVRIDGKWIDVKAAARAGLI
ncbi:TPA: hypothetical protein QDB19_004901 [Burkholderia vietnamiensis]|nr:hypothetical protein [Burkholderia vietnamiensis]